MIVVSAAMSLLQNAGSRGRNIEIQQLTTAPVVFTEVRRPTVTYRYRYTLAVAMNDHPPHFPSFVPVPPQSHLLPPLFYL